ncbi:MAG: DUF4363 family protein [Oscillospiraceae bacterium]|nr:DUF4363 family protein [Oscillospiraceae bacterium]
MIREIIAIVLLAALLALSIFNVGYIEKKADILSGEIDEAHELYKSGDKEGACSLVRESRDNWLGWEAYSHIMLRHSEIDVITSAYFELLSELEGGERVADASFEALIETLSGIVSKERLTLGSLL